MYNDSTLRLSPIRPSAEIISYLTPDLPILNSATQFLIVAHEGH